MVNLCHILAVRRATIHTSRWVRHPATTSARITRRPDTGPHLVVRQWRDQLEQRGARTLEAWAPAEHNLERTNDQRFTDAARLNLFADMAAGVSACASPEQETVAAAYSRPARQVFADPYYFTQRGLPITGDPRETVQLTIGMQHLLAAARGGSQACARAAQLVLEGVVSPSLTAAAKASYAGQLVSWPTMPCEPSYSGGWAASASWLATSPKHIRKSVASLTPVARKRTTVYTAWQGLGIRRHTHVLNVQPLITTQQRWRRERRHTSCASPRTFGMTLSAGRPYDSCGPCSFPARAWSRCQLDPIGFALSTRWAIRR